MIWEAFFLYLSLSEQPRIGQSTLVDFIKKQDEMKHQYKAEMTINFDNYEKNNP